MKKIQLVEVEWIDSAFHRGWSSTDTKQREMAISVCRSVGYLVSRDKKVVNLVMHSADKHTSLGDGLSIPTVAVKRVRQLK